jgi:hypothetical protein
VRAKQETEFLITETVPVMMIRPVAAIACCLPMRLAARNDPGALKTTHFLPRIMQVVRFDVDGGNHGYA